MQQGCGTPAVLTLGARRSWAAPFSARCRWGANWDSYSALETLWKKTLSTDVMAPIFADVLCSRRPPLGADSAFPPGYVRDLDDDRIMARIAFPGLESKEAKDFMSCIWWTEPKPEAKARYREIRVAPGAGLAGRPPS